MRIINLSKERCPEGEVLAFGYQENLIVGYLSGNKNCGFTCESDGQTLDEVTHVIDCKDLVEFFKQKIS